MPFSARWNRLTSDTRRQVNCFLAKNIPARLERQSNGDDDWQELGGDGCHRFSGAQFLFLQARDVYLRTFGVCAMHGGGSVAEGFLREAFGLTGTASNGVWVSITDGRLLHYRQQRENIAITSQPRSQTAVVGGPVALSVAATDTAPFSYQWRYNGQNFSGATSSSLSWTSVQPAQAGSYSVIFSNCSGSVTSTEANLFVISDTNLFFSVGQIPDAKVWEGKRSRLLSSARISALGLCCPRRSLAARSAP